MHQVGKDLSAFGPYTQSLQEFATVNFLYRKSSDDGALGFREVNEMRLETVVLRSEAVPEVTHISFRYNIAVKADGREIGRFDLVFRRRPTEKELRKKIKKKVKQISRELRLER